MTITTKRSIIALLLSLVLVISLFTIGISAAEDDETTPNTESGQVAESDGADGEKDTGNKETGNKETGDKETNGKDEGGKDEGGKTEPKPEKVDPVKEETKMSLIVNGIIVAAIIIVLIFLYVKFHSKFNAFLRSVKSELKKIVWSSKENTRKGFLIVAVVAVAFGVALGLADFAFSTGFDKLPELISKLFSLVPKT